MNRTAYSALLAQYATPEVSGDGRVSWDGGVKCVMPNVKLYGKCGQNGTPTLEAPVPVKCNNGTFVARSRNLTNMYDLTGWHTSANTPTIDYVQAIISAPVSTVFTISADVYNEGVTTNPFSWRIAYLDETDTPRTDYLLGTPEQGSAYRQTNVYVKTHEMRTVSASYYATGNGENNYAKNIQIEYGDTASPYTPYYDGGTIQAPKLLAIPGTDIRDEWDAQTGRGIRRCGQYTFSGAEPFVLSGGVTPPDYNVYYAYAAVPNVPAAANNPGLCTHLNRKPSMYGNEMGVIFGVSNNQIYFSVPKETYPDAETWKAYLAAQYAAGTPVTIVYIIAEPEPFYSPPAPLTMPRGSGQIIQTGGDAADCPITARYLTHS